MQTKDIGYRKIRNQQFRKQWMTRVVSLCLGVSCIFGSGWSVDTYGAEAASVKMGDVDRSGVVNASDALLVLQGAANAVTLTSEQKKAADVDGNDMVNANDALLILQYAAGVISNFPASGTFSDAGQGMTEAKARQKIVSIMASWVGLNEADGSHKQIIDIYNSQKPLPNGYKVQYTDAWCATTVSAAAVLAEMTDIIPSQCNCSLMITCFQKLGAWVEDDAYVPSPGDLMFFDWNDSGVGDSTGRSTHVGMVESVSGNTITVIEGNCSDAVKRMKYKVNGRYIRGYGTPKYWMKAIK